MRSLPVTIACSAWPSRLVHANRATVLVCSEARAEGPARRRRWRPARASPQARPLRVWIPGVPPRPQTAPCRRSRSCAGIEAVAPRAPGSMYRPTTGSEVRARTEYRGSTGRAA